MRECDAEVVERERPIRGVSRRGRQRQRLTLARDRAEDRVDESGCAALADLLGQVDGIVHDGRRGHPGVMQELVRAQTEDFDNLRIESGNGALGEGRDQTIECGPPTLDASCDVGG